MNDELERYPPDLTLPRHEQKVWRGEALDGKRVLIRCAHGLGDTIQFIRYAPLVKRVASEVIVCAQPSLLPLLETAKGIDRLVPSHDGAPEVEHDVEVEVTELAHVFRSTVETLPNDAPYLHVDALELPRDHRMRAGVAWRADDGDPLRSIPFALIRRLASASGVTFYALQRELEGNETSGPFVVLPEREDPLNTARLIRALDLVISIDSTPAHLAGALGIPVWTLLPTHPDGRWMDNRTDSPWYSSMRLYRQTDGWESVIAEVVRDLKVQTHKSHIRIDVDDHSTYLPLRHSV